MSMQNKPIKYAFTARALYEALREYGRDVFKLADKIYVVEQALINLPELKFTKVLPNIHVDDISIPTNQMIAGYIYENWFNIVSPPPFGHNPETTHELIILGKFQQTDPDNIYVVFNDLRELSFLNRIYSDDELLTISDLRTHLK